jgi:hypothetical protein
MWSRSSFKIWMRPGRPDTYSRCRLREHGVPRERVEIELRHIKPTFNKSLNLSRYRSGPLYDYAALALPLISLGWSSAMAPERRTRRS